MEVRRAVLFKEGQPFIHGVGTRKNGEFYPYLMYGGELYVRAEQSDQHEKGVRVPAYRWAEFYKVD